MYDTGTRYMYKSSKFFCFRSLIFIFLTFKFYEPFLLQTFSSFYLYVQISLDRLFAKKLQFFSQKLVQSVSLCHRLSKKLNFIKI